ncbi:MAG TPA: family 16 glycoside hydrolase [Verrucomicrobiae bacterium]|nr:family 16 glycoside hydrolase [Verrucomicrobiae bacterium]
MKSSFFLGILLCAFVPVISGADDDGFVPLFNGQDLTGWVNANCAPETWSVRDGMIHCTGHPTGAIRTARQYENFILEVEWRHLVSGGNSGVFIWGTPIAAPGVPFLRGIEVQVLDHGYNAKGKNEWYTTHGDVFPIHGASMKPFGRHNGERSFPSEERSKGFPEWNHYRIVCTNGVLRLSVNGKEVSGGEDCNYRKGYLALESEGAPVDFRNIRIKELPSTGAPPELSAPIDLGWRALFTGLDLRGWKTNAATETRWQVRDERLHIRDGSADLGATLRSDKEFGDAEFIIDCRPAKNARDATPATIEFRGTEIKLPDAEAGKYQRYTITAKGRAITVKRNDKEVGRVAISSEAPQSNSLGLRDTGTAVEFMNLYVRDL